MKKSAFTAIFTITAMVLSSLITPCRAQVPESQVEGMTVDKDPVYISEEVDEDMVFTTYETQPEFPGGMWALMEYIKNDCAIQRNAVRQELKAEPSSLSLSRRTVR